MRKTPKKVVNKLLTNGVHMEKIPNKYPSHLRVNKDPAICKAVMQTKVAISAKTGRKRVSDHDALLELIFSNNGQASIVDVLPKEMKGVKEKCCIYEPKIRGFPFGALEQIMFHFIDGHLTKDELVETFKTLTVKATIVEDRVLEKIKDQGGKRHGPP